MSKDEGTARQMDYNYILNRIEHNSLSAESVPTTSVKELEPVKYEVKSRFLQLIDKMVDIQKRKNAGYAGQNKDPWANFKLSTMVGVKPSVGSVIRMTDKLIRVCNLMKNPANEQVGESITDTLIDLANYALITLCLWEEENADTKNS